METPCSGASGTGRGRREWRRLLWTLYWLAAVVATVIGIHDVLIHGIDTLTGGFMIHTSVVLQSVLGLMLLSVQAPSALGEERVRGSLDVLMAAPISTGAILWGKWMGTYRVALGLAVLPGLAAVTIATTCPDISPRFTAAASRFPIEPLSLGYRMLVPVLIVAELLSGGAALTSLGLLLATWTPRIGRAIGTSLAFFLLISFGWMFLVGLVILPVLHGWLYSYGYNTGVNLFWIDQGLMALSPIAAPIGTIQSLDIAYAGRWLLVIVTVWCLLACAAAGAMYVAVLGSFDRRLGRMSETSREPCPPSGHLAPPTKYA